MTKTDWL